MKNAWFSCIMYHRRMWVKVRAFSVCVHCCVYRMLTKPFFFFRLWSRSLMDPWPATLALLRSLFQMKAAVLVPRCWLLTHIKSMLNHEHHTFTLASQSPSASTGLCYLLAAQSVGHKEVSGTDAAHWQQTSGRGAVDSQFLCIWHSFYYFFTAPFVFAGKKECERQREKAWNVCGGNIRWEKMNKYILLKRCHSENIAPFWILHVNWGWTCIPTTGEEKGNTMKQTNKVVSMKQWSSRPAPWDLTSMVHIMIRLWDGCNFQTYWTGRDWKDWLRQEERDIGCITLPVI